MGVNFLRLGDQTRQELELAKRTRAVPIQLIQNSGVRILFYEIGTKVGLWWLLW